MGHICGASNMHKIQRRPYKRSPILHGAQLQRGHHPVKTLLFSIDMKSLVLSVFTLYLATVACQNTAPPLFYPCPFLGSTYLKPVNLINDPTIKAAIKNTTAVILDALATGLLDNQTTAFSLTAFSTSDEDSIPFYTFHQTPPILAEAPIGVKNVTSDTVYRLGSLSKVMTVYTLLVADGFKHFQDPISTFIPALLKGNTNQDASSDPITSTNWEEITLQALASHMGGIGVECELLN